MGGFTGFLQVGIELGLDAILVKPKRSIGEFQAMVTLEENHEDELEITEQPVEQGAAITDHAFKRPAKLTIHCGWSNSPGSSSLLGSLVGAVTGTIGGIASLLTGNSESQVKDIYQRFLALQESRVPFDVYTGKRVYTNMLIKGLGTITTKETENSIFFTVRLQQILIVAPATELAVTAPAADQEAPEDTDPTEDEGDQQATDADSYNEDAGAETMDTTDIGDGNAEAERNREAA